MHRFLLFLACLAIAAFGLSTVAWAHAHVDKSSPADGAQLPESPRNIRVTFTENIDASVSRLTLVNPAGQVVSGTTQSVPDDATLVLTIPPLTSGVYKLEWEVLSTDTHMTAGYFTFSVGTALPQTVPLQPSEQAPAGEGPAAPGPSQSGNSFPWVWVVVGTGVLILIAVAVRRR